MAHATKDQLGLKSRSVAIVLLSVSAAWVNNLREARVGENL